MLKGVAILSMLMLHLFCRTENLPYTPLLWVGSTPLIYYFGLFGDICVSIYCFVSGYAHYMQSSEEQLRQRWKRLLRFMIPFWIIAVLFSLIGLLTGNAVIPGSVTEFLLNCLTVKNSYNGAWWYANTYLLLVAFQPLSKKFAERCPAWLMLLSAFAFYTVGYGIRFWGWGACDSVVLSWIITHIGLLGTSYFPYVIGMLFCKKQVISLLRQRLTAVKTRYIYIYIYIDSYCLCVHDHRPRHRADAFCGGHYGDRNYRPALHLSFAKAADRFAVLLRRTFHKHLACSYVLLYGTV